MTLYILKRDIVVPAGTQFKDTEELGEGGVDTVIDEGMARVFLSRQVAILEGLIEQSN
jgi:hypothetical protein